MQNTTAIIRSIGLIIGGLGATLILIDSYFTDNEPSTTPTNKPTPVVTRWLNQTCSPVGATAQTISGGTIVCRAVGSEVTPEWHTVR